MFANGASAEREQLGYGLGNIGIQRLESRIYLASDLMQVLQTDLSQGVTIDHPGDVTLGSFLTINSPTLSFNVGSDQGQFTGSVTITANSAELHLGSLTSSISAGSSGSIALSGTYTLDGQSAGGGKFAFTVEEFGLSVANFFSANATGVEINYDPGLAAGQTLISLESLGLTLAGTGTSFTATASDSSADLLTIYDNGFHLETSTQTVSNITIGSFLDVPSLTVTLPEISYQAGSPLAVSGTIGLQADSATLTVRTGLTAALEPFTTTPGLFGTYDIESHAFALEVGQGTLSIPNLFEATVTQFEINYDPEDTDPHQLVTSFHSLDLTLTPLGTSFTAAATDSNADLLTIYSDGFTLAASTQTISDITVGSFLDIPSLIITLPEISYEAGSSLAITGAIGLEADSATLAVGTYLTAALEPAGGQNSPALEGSYDLQSHKFFLNVAHATFAVPSLFEATATDFEINYEPDYSGQHQPLLSLGSLGFSLTGFDTTFTAAATDSNAHLLTVYDDGFLLAASTATVSNITIGSFLDVPSLIVTLPEISYQTGSSVVIGGIVGLQAESANLSVGSGFSAALQPTDDQSMPGLAGNYNIESHAFDLAAGQATLTVTSLFEAHVTGFQIQYDPESTARQSLFSFTSLDLTLSGTGTSFDVHATQPGTDLLTIYNDGFQLEASTTTVTNFAIGGFLEVPSLTVTLPEISYQTGSSLGVVGTVGLTAELASLTLGTGLEASLEPDQSNSVPGIDGSYDIESHRFHLAVGQARLSIPGLFESRVTHTQINYDPESTAQHQSVASFGSLHLTLTALGTSFDAAAIQPSEDLLTIYDDGFHLAASAATISNISIGSFLDVDSLTVTLPEISYQADSPVEISGTIGLRADSAALNVGTGLSAELAPSDDFSVPGLDGTFDIQSHRFQLDVGQATLTVPNLLEAHTTRLHINYDLEETGRQTLVSLDELNVNLIPLNGLEVQLNSLTIYNDGFTLGNGAVSVDGFTLNGVLSITEPTVSFSGVSFTVAEGSEPEAKLGSIGLSGSVSLFPGASEFTASVKDFSGSYDFEANTFLASASAVNLQVSDFLKFDSTDISITLGSEFEIAARSVAVSSPRFFGVSGSLGELDITSEGFSVGSVTLGAATAGTPVALGSVFSFLDFQVSVTDFSFVYGTGQATFGPDSEVAVSADTVNLNLGSSSFVTASAQNIEGSIGLGTDSLGDFTFDAGSVHFNFGDYLSFDGQNIGFNTAPEGSENVADFGLIAATLSIPNFLTVSGEARNFSITNNGTFQPGADFGVSFATNADASKFGWPDWLPLPQITMLDVNWPNLTSDPLNFDLALSGNIHAKIPRTDIQLDGLIEDLRINTGLLVSGAFPITGLGGVGLSAKGSVFGNEVEGAFLISMLSLDDNGEIIEAGSTTVPAERVLFGAIDAGLKVVGMAGFEIRLGMSQYGPLEGYLSATATVPVNPVPPGFVFKNFHGGIQFAHELPAITDARQLAYNEEFNPHPELSLLQWKNQLAQQVQRLAKGIDAVAEDPWALLEQPITVRGGATIAAVQAPGFEATGDIMFSMGLKRDVFSPNPSADAITPRFVLAGTVQLNSSFVVGGKLYGDLSKMMEGDGTFLMDVEVPAAPNQVLTLYGGVSLDIPENQLTITGGIEISAIEGVNISIDGKAVIHGALDGDPLDSLDIEVSGDMEVDPLGRLANVAGRIHLERDYDTLIEQIWGAIVLRPEQIPGLQDLGLDIDGIAAIRFNSSGLLLDEPHDETVTLQVPRSNGQVESYTFDLPAKSMSLFVEGEVGFGRNGTQYFDLHGKLDATFEVSSTTYVDLPLMNPLSGQPIKVPVHTYSLDVIGTGVLSIGPTSSPYATFEANGFLEINSPASPFSSVGVAAQFDVTAAAGGSLDSKINATGNLQLTFNTTEEDVEFTVPAGFPNEGTIVTVPAAPAFNGQTIGVPAPYLAVVGSGELSIVSHYGLEGEFGLLVRPTELDAYLDASVTAGPLGTVGTAQGQLVINSQGIAGSLLGALGSGASGDTFHFGGGFQLQVNTTSESRSFPGFTVNQTTGTISSTQFVTVSPRTTRLMIGGSLTVKDMEILNGEFGLTVSSGSVTADLHAALNAGPLGHVAGAQGSLTIDTNGIYGNLSLGAGTSIPGVGFSFSGEVQLGINGTPTPRSITGFDVDPATGVISAGEPIAIDPYTLQLVIGGSLNISNAAKIVGRFDMALNTTAVYAHAVGSVLIGPPAEPFAKFDIDKSLKIVSGGLVADVGINLNSSSGLEELGGALTINGEARLRINTSLQNANYTAPPGFANAGIPVVVPAIPPTFPDGTTFTNPMPYIVVTAAGGLKIEDAFDLSGNLGLLVTPSKLDAYFNGTVIAGPLGVVGHAQGMLAVSLAGIVANVQGTATAGSDAAGYHIDGGFQLEVNTTDNPHDVRGFIVNTSNGAITPNQTLHLAPQTAKLVVGGTLDAGGFDLNGAFEMTASSAGLIMNLNARTDIFDQTFTVSGIGGIYSNDALGAGGLVFDIRLGAAALTSGAAYITGDAKILVNSSPVTRLGINGFTYQVTINNVDVEMYGFHATGSLAVGASNGIARIEVPASAPLTVTFMDFGLLEISGFIGSNGSFDLVASGTVNLLTPDSQWGVYIDGNIHFSNNGIYGHLDGYGKAAGVNLATISADLSLQSTRYIIHATASALGLPPVTVDFTLGGITGPLATAPPPSISLTGPTTADVIVTSSAHSYAVTYTAVATVPDGVQLFADRDGHNMLATWSSDTGTRSAYVTAGQPFSYTYFGNSPGQHTITVSVSANGINGFGPTNSRSKVLNANLTYLPFVISEFSVPDSVPLYTLTYDYPIPTPYIVSGNLKTDSLTQYGDIIPGTLHGTYYDPATGTTGLLSWKVSLNGQELPSVNNNGGTFNLTAPGDYEVTGYAVNYDGSLLSRTATIHVENPGPAILTTQGPNNYNPIAYGSAATYRASVGYVSGPLTYRWTATHDGTTIPQITSTGTTTGPLSFTFGPDQPGNYSVSLEVTDQFGGQKSYTYLPLTVLPFNGPEVLSVSIGNAQFNQGSLRPGQLDAIVTDNIPFSDFTYDWEAVGGYFMDNGAARSTAHTSSVSFVPQASPTGVKLTVTNIVTGKTATTALGSIQLPPMLGVTIAGAPSISTAGATINLTSTVAGTAPFTYLWNVTRNGIPYATGSNSGISFTPNSDGIYHVNLSITDSAGLTGSNTQIVSILAVPPTVSITGVPTAPVPGVAISLQSTVSNPSAAVVAAGYQYSWNVLKNGILFATSPDRNFTFTPDGFGYYEVTFSATSNEALTGTATKTIAVLNSQGQTTTTLSSSNASAVYGQAVTFEATVSADHAGFGVPAGTILFYSDTTLLDTATLDANGRATSKPITGLGAGVYQVSAVYHNAGDGAFFDSTSAAITQTVAKARLTVTADDQSMTYGSIQPILTATITGFQNGESLATSGIVGSPSFTTVAGNSHAGHYAIFVGPGTLQGMANYVFAPADFVSGSLSITPAPLTITANDQVMEYHGTLPTLTATFTGLVNGDTRSAVSGLTIATVPASSNPGSYEIVASGATDSDYTITFQTGVLIINPPIPTLRDMTLIVGQDYLRTFAASDFDAALVDPFPVYTTWMQVASLPVHGNLQLFGVPVTVGQEIPRSDLAWLIYVPDALFTGQDQFTWTAAAAAKAYAAAPATAIMNVQPDAVVIRDFTIETNQGQSLGLTLRNFADNYQDTLGVPLQSVRIASLPTGGSLELNGVLVAAGQDILAADLNGLEYHPNLSFSGTDHFTWNDSSTLSASPAVVNITVRPELIQLQSVKLVTRQYVTATFTTENFAAALTDNFSRPLQSVRFASLPGGGTLSLGGVPVTINQEISAADLASVTYSPNSAFAGLDNFTWQASTGLGFSVTAAVSVDVLARANPITLVSGLNRPYEVDVDAAGNLYIADSNSGSIKLWNAATHEISTLISGFGSPTGVAVDSNGNVYASMDAPTNTGSIVKWNATTHQVTTLVSGLTSPQGVAVDADGNVFFANTNLGLLQEVAATTNSIITLASYGFTPDFSAFIGYPAGVAVDGSGNVYFGDGGTAEFHVLNLASNHITTLFGSDINGSAAAIDAAGNVYISSFNNVVYQWSPATGQFMTLASGLNEPHGVAVDGAGNVYVADTRNNVIKEVINAYVSIAPISEPGTAGSDELTVTATTPVSLTGAFAPSSNQSWLTLGTPVNNTVPFTFTANPGAARTAVITLLGRQITVTQAAATVPTTTTINAPSITYGNDGIVTISQSSGSGVPTGTVTLVVDGGAPITQGLVNGSSTFTIPGLNAGNHSLSVTYTPQGAFDASSAVGTLVVNKASSFTTTVGTGPFVYTGGVQVAGSGTVTVAGGLSVAVTSVSYSANSDGTGTADMTNAGRYYVTAHFAGDANHLPSDGLAVAITINKATSTTTTNGGGPFTYDGTSHAGGSGTVAGAGTVTGEVTLTYSGDQINSGIYYVTAHYAGDANHEASDGSAIAITINKATTTTITIGAGPFTYDGTTHAGGSGTVAGAGTVTGGVTLTYSGDQVNAGTYYVTSHYAGDANHEASDGAAVAITINKATSTTTTVGAGPFVYDGTTHSGGSGTVVGAGTVTGEVTLSYSGDQINSGTYYITAHYAGDANHEASDGAAVAITINKAASTTTTIGTGAFTYDGTTHAGGSGTVAGAGTVTGGVTLTYSGDQINAGTFYVTAHYAGDANHEASDGAAVAITINKATSTTTTIGTGPFTYDGTTHSGGSGTVAGAGTVTGGVTLTYSGNQVNAGTYYVTAHYAGDANHQASDGAAIAITINKAALTVTADNKTKFYGTNVQLTYTVTGLVPGDTTAVVTGVVLSTATGAAATVGTHTIVATGATAANYTITNINGTLTVIPAITTTTVTSSANPSIYGQSVTFTAAVSDQSSPAMPTGQVQFVIDGQNFGAPVTVNAYGQATISTSGLDLTTVSQTVSIGFVGLNFVTISGNTTSDSYNAELGSYSTVSHDNHGDYASNGKITVSGNSVVNGNARPGPGQADSITGNSIVTGSTTPLGQRIAAAPVALGNVSTVNNNSSIPLSQQGKTAYNASSRAFSLGGNDTITLSPGSYYFSSFSISGNATVIVTGPTKIYSTGNIEISGGGMVNLSGLPENLRLFSTGNSSNKITLSGNSSLYGVVYAPTVPFTRSGNSDLYGSVLALSITSSGNGGMHLDTSLSAAHTIQAIYVNNSGNFVGSSSAVIQQNVKADTAIGSFQTTDGFSSTHAIADFTNILVQGTLTVSVQDDTGGSITDEELARISDAMSTVNNAFGAYGVTLVWADSVSAADVHIHFATSTPYGGKSDGVLGFTTESLDVYLVSDWTFYTGSDANGVDPDSYDFQTLVTHELGHVIGLGEGYDPTSVMFQYLPAGVSRREFGTDLTVIEGVADRFMHSEPVGLTATEQPVDTSTEFQFLRPTEDGPDFNANSMFGQSIPMTGVIAVKPGRLIDDGRDAAFCSDVAANSGANDKPFEGAPYPGVIGPAAIDDLFRELAITEFGLPDMFS